MMVLLSLRPNRTLAPPPSPVSPAKPAGLGQIIPDTITTAASTTSAAVTHQIADPTAGQISRVVALLNAWEDNDDSALRPQRLQELGELLSGTNSLAIVQTLPPDLMGYAFASSSLRQRLMADPSAALDWMLTHTNVFASQGLTLIHDWQQIDATALQTYIDAVPDAGSRQKILALAGDAALSRDPMEIILWARQLNPGETQTRLLRMAATDWAGQDPNAAVDWVGQIGAPALREQLTSSLIAGYAQANPAQAADWLVQTVPSGNTLNQAAADIVWNWTQTDPVAAGDWVQNFPAGDAREAALADLVNVWGNHDPAALAVWIASLSDDSLRASATGLFSKLAPIETPR